MVRENELARARRHSRIRKRVSGTVARPRLSVSRSLNHIYAQIIDDTGGNTLCSASTVDKELKALLKTGGNVAASKAVGTLIAKKAIQKGITKVVFDRGGYPYHGRIKALADAAREAGLEF